MQHYISQISVQLTPFLENYGYAVVGSFRPYSCSGLWFLKYGGETVYHFKEFDGKPLIFKKDIVAGCRRGMQALDGDEPHRSTAVTLRFICREINAHSSIDDALKNLVYI